MLGEEVGTNRRYRTRFACEDPPVTNAGGTLVDLHGFPNAPMPVENLQPAYSSWVKRVAASVLDGAIGAGVTFLALGDQSVTVPFIGASFLPPVVQGVPATSWTDSGWVVATVLLMITMQAYLGVTRASW